MKKETAKAIMEAGASVTPIYQTHWKSTHALTELSMYITDTGFKIKTPEQEKKLIELANHVKVIRDDLNSLHQKDYMIVQLEYRYEQAMQENAKMKKEIESARKAFDELESK